MKKILAFAAAGLLAVGFVGCNSKGASGSSETMDSLSIAFGDLYGAGMGQQLRSMDSTINMDLALKGMEYIANADTSQAFMQGLQLMSEGSQYRLFIPSELAYGSKGAGEQIAPNSTLIFDVELIKVNKK